jgi:hypothetical protein
LNTHVRFRFDLWFFLNPLPARTLLCPAGRNQETKPPNKMQTVPSNLFKLNLVFATCAADIASCITARLKFLQIRK